MFNLSRIESVLYILILFPTLYCLYRGAPFVPTHMNQVKRMLSAVPLKKGMKVVDLGSGDGRLVHWASLQYGADATGYEFSPLVFAWSKLLQIGWMLKGSRARILWRNFWTQDLSNVDVVVCYLLTGTMERMEKELMPQLKDGTWIISNAFQFKNLKAIKVLPRSESQRLGRVWVYRVSKAKVSPVRIKKTNPKVKKQPQSVPSSNRQKSVRSPR